MRMKVFCCNIKEHRPVVNGDPVGDPYQVDLCFTPVYEGSEENKQFWDATPAGSIEMNITNVNAVPKDLKYGDEFYVDFTKAD